MGAIRGGYEAGKPVAVLEIDPDVAAEMLAQFTDIGRGATAWRQGAEPEPRLLQHPLKSGEAGKFEI